MAKDQSEITKKAKQYLEKHQIEEILGDMLNTLTHHQIPNPIIYMIKYLSTTHSTPKELEQSGISIKIDQESIYYTPLIPYPDLTKINGIVKKHLTKEVFYQCKNKITPYGNTFRTIHRLILDQSKNKIGLFAVDPASYQTYEPLFEPIIKDKTFQYIPSRDLHFSLQNSILENARPYLEECVTVLRRNIDKHRFNSTLNSRDQLTKELMQIIGQQSIINYTHKSDLGPMCNEEIKKLQINDRLYKKKESNIIQNQFKDLRHPDWPNNRMLLQSHDRQNIVWINREDHLKFKFLSHEKPSLIEQLDKCIKMSDYLKTQASFDDKYGYTTVKPSLSGMGLTFSLKFKFEPSQFVKIKTNLNQKQNLNKHIFQMTLSKDNKYLTIKFDKCAGYNLKYIIDTLSQTLVLLFDGVVELQSQQQQQIQQILQDHVAIEIEEEELDYQLHHSERLKKLQPLGQPNKIENIVKMIKEDGLYLETQIIKQKFIIVRRNLAIRKQQLDELININTQQIDSNDILKQANLIDKPCSAYQKNLKNYQYYLLLNYDDDFTWIFPLQGFSISQQLHKIDKIVSQIKQKFAFSEQIGYLTNDNKYIGTGISLLIEMNIHPQLIQDQIMNVKLIENCSLSDQCLILNSFNQQYFQLFRQMINDLLIKEKQKKNHSRVIDNIINEMDCFLNKQLWAPKVECFTEYADLYQQYLKKSGISLYLDLAINFFSKLKLDPQLYSLEGPLKIIQEKANLKITCTFHRNFERFRYPHEMSQSEKEQLKAQLMEYIQKKGILKEEYKIKYNKVHHLTIQFTGYDNDFINLFQSTWQALEVINKEFKLQFHPNLGYLGPDLNQALLEGFQMEIKARKKNFDKSTAFSYSMEETNDQQHYIFRSQRPCNFSIEREFLQSYLDAK